MALTVTESEGKVRRPLRNSEDDLKTCLNQHLSLLGEILPNFDIYNLSVALKLKTLIQRKKEISSVAELSPACILVSRPKITRSPSS